MMEIVFCPGLYQVAHELTYVRRLLISICVPAISAFPFVSEYWNVNVCCDPLPELGLTPTTTGAACPLTVHVPSVCQLELLPPTDCAWLYRFLLPANDE